MSDIVNAINRNAIIYTDMFNIKKLELKKIYDPYNFIILEDDIVNLKIFKTIAKNVNNFEDKKLKPVYVNPTSLNSYSTAIFTKPPNLNLNLTNETIQNIFHFNLHTLQVYDNLELSHAMLSLENIGDLNLTTKILQSNLLYTPEQNMDILIQNLLVSNINIDAQTYNSLYTLLDNYQGFKNLRIKNNKNLDFLECDNGQSLKYSLLGFNLTEIPI